MPVRLSPHVRVWSTLWEVLIADVVLHHGGCWSLEGMEGWDWERWTCGISPITSCPASLCLSLSLFILSDLIVNDMLIVNEAGLAWRPLCVLMWTCSGSGQGAVTRLMFTSLHVLQLTYICPLLEKTQGYWDTDHVYCCSTEKQVCSCLKDCGL